MKKVKTIRLFALLCLSFVGFNAIQAQQATSLNFMNLLPQSSQYNPAKNLNTRWYMSIPALGTVNFTLENSLGSLNSIKHVEDSTTYVDVKKFVNQLNNKSLVGINFYYEPISFGFRVAEKHFIDIAAFYSVKADFVLSKDFVRFFVQGPINYIDINTPLGGAYINANAYKGVSVGWQYQVDKKLSIGAKFKYLMGDLNLATKKADLSYLCKTNGNIPYETTVTTDLEIIGSAPGDSLNLNMLNSIDDQDLMDWVLDFGKNSGFALDFGANYRVSDKLTVSASVIDLGFISWNTGCKKITSNASFTIDGFELSELTNENNEVNSNFFNSFVDTLMEDLQLERKLGENYKQRMETKLAFGAEYQLTKNDMFGAMYRIDFNHKYTRPSFSVGYTHTFWNTLGITINNTIIDKRFWNFGGGLVLGAGPYQLYFIVDQVNSIYVASMRSVNFQFGMNVKFRHRDVKKKIEPIVIDPTFTR